MQYFKGVPSPVKHPELIDMVIYRENTEDIYAGVEWQSGSDACKKVVKFLQEEMGVSKIRFPETSGIGIKPVSKEGTERLVRAAIKYAITNKRKSVTSSQRIMRVSGNRDRGTVACPGRACVPPQRSSDSWPSGGHQRGHPVAAFEPHRLGAHAAPEGHRLLPRTHH